MPNFQSFDIYNGFWFRITFWTSISLCGSVIDVKRTSSTPDDKENQIRNVNCLRWQWLCCSSPNFDSIAIEFDLPTRNSSSFCCVIHLFYCRCYCCTVFLLNSRLLGDKESDKEASHRKSNTKNSHRTLILCAMNAKKGNHPSILITFSPESNRTLTPLATNVSVAIAKPPLFGIYTETHSCQATESEANRGGTNGTNLISERTLDVRSISKNIPCSVRDGRFVHFSDLKREQKGNEGCHRCCFYVYSTILFDMIFTKVEK